MHKKNSISGHQPKYSSHTLFTAFIDEIASEVAKRIEPNNLPDMLSARTIAQKLDCSESEVRQNIQLGRIQSVRFGSRGYRVAREEYEKRLIQWKNGGVFWD